MRGVSWASCLAFNKDDKVLFFLLSNGIRQTSDLFHTVSFFFWLIHFSSHSFFFFFFFPNLNFHVAQLFWKLHVLEYCLPYPEIAQIISEAEALEREDSLALLEILCASREIPICSSIWDRSSCSWSQQNSVSGGWDLLQVHCMCWRAPLVEKPALNKRRVFHCGNWGENCFLRILFPHALGINTWDLLRYRAPAPQKLSTKADFFNLKREQGIFQVFLENFNPQPSPNSNLQQ